MKKTIICLGLIFSFIFISMPAYADEISELKEQMSQIQQQFRQQQKFIEEQNKQMEIMQKKIEVLEIEKAKTKEPAQAKLEAPQEVEKRVTALEERFSKKDILIPRWKDGLTFTTEDKQFEMKIGGRLHLDSAYFKPGSGVEDKVGSIKNGAEARRAHIAKGGCNQSKS